MEKKLEDRRHYMGRIPKDLRHFVLERDNYTCKFCGTGNLEALLEIHHIIWKIMGGTNNPENLMTVCPRCHDIIHYGKIIDRPYTLSQIRQRQGGN